MGKTIQIILQEKFFCYICTQNQTYKNKYQINKEIGSLENDRCLKTHHEATNTLMLNKKTNYHQCARRKRHNFYA